MPKFGAVVDARNRCGASIITEACIVLVRTLGYGALKNGIVWSVAVFRAVVLVFAVFAFAISAFGSGTFEATGLLHADS